MAAAENSDDWPADGGREMQRTGVVADVETGGLKERGKNGHFTVAA